jgi:hypothetical protein
MVKWFNKAERRIILSNTIHYNNLGLSRKKYSIVNASTVARAPQ